LLVLHLSCVATASAQQWAADVYAGATRYDAIASLVAAANIAGTLRVDGKRAFGYLSAAAPLDSDAPYWSALGAGIRLRHDIGAGIRAGLDTGGDAYVYRHASAAAGRGATTHVLPQLTLVRDAIDIQLRAGRRDHHADGASSRSHRYTYEAGTLATVRRGTIAAAAEVRVLATSTESYPMAQLQLASSLGAARLWASAGRWFGDDLQQTVWSAGASIDISRGELWIGARRDADPLYMNPVRTSWNVGYSMKLGRSEAVIAAPVLRDGMIVVRLPRDRRAAPSVAGEFSDWQPVPMRADADEWVLEIAAPPGVYRFAFVAADGTWYVPEGYPGRMDDDMGGHVAVVVVP
jgi:hypothetical protein